MEPTGCPPKGRHSAWAPIAGLRSAIGEREFAIVSGGPPPPFQSDSPAGRDSLAHNAGLKQQDA